MEFNPLAGLEAPTTPTTPEPRDDLGQADFLRMLIAQLESQDPLNPQDATEFTAQLAQFSSLEQLLRIDESLQDLETSQASLASMSTLGRDVLFYSDRFEVGADGNAISNPAFELTEPAAGGTLRVFDARDVQIAEIDIGGPRAAGIHVLDSQPLPEELRLPGVYRFELETGERSAEPILLTRGTVSGATPVGGEPQLSVGRLVTPYSELREIRPGTGVAP